MKLLGSYQSNLVTFHKQELIALLEEAVSAGEYGGGKLIDAAVGAELSRQAADFANLPAISAGSRATAHSILYPLQLLAARYETISKERVDFLERMRLFLDVLEKDSSLIDQLIAAANMETWVSRRGALSTAYKFYQDFAASHGAVSVDLPLTDPVTGVPYDKPVSDVTFLLNPVAGLELQPVRCGIGVPAEVREIAPVNLRWHYDGQAENEELDGSDWAKLSLLAPAPALRYLPPVMSVMAPAGASAAETFEISGSSQAANVPVFIRTFFRPRAASKQILTAAAGLEVPISNYKLLGDDFMVLDDDRSYERGVDYKVDSIGRFVPFAITANKTLTILYTEMFPAYQASVNQSDWSSPVMFDAARPELGTLTIADGRFPVLDEADSPLGFYIKLRKIPVTDYLLRIDTVVTPDYGVTATLEVELDRAAYINGFHLGPFVNYPVRLKSITAEGLSESTGRVIYDGDIVLDRDLSVRFDRQLVRRLFFRFYQENYTYKEHVIDPLDKLRRDTLVALQASLPFSSRRFQITPARRIEGVQYEFGVRDLRAQDWSAVMPQDFGVFIAGPFEVPGTPELIRLDAEYCGDARFYLIDSPYNQSDLLTGSAFHATNPHGIELVPGQAFSYTPPPEVAKLARCQFHLKCVLRDPYAVVERYLLQVTTNV